MRSRALLLLPASLLAFACTDVPTTVSHSTVVPDSESSATFLWRRRFTVASIVVTPTALSLESGMTEQLSATPLNASGDPVTGQTVVWSTSSGAVASVSTTGVVTAVNAGTAAIQASVGTVTGSATVAVSGTAPAPQPVPAPAPRGTDQSHEPSGFAVFTNRSFNSKAASSSDAAGAEGWDAGEEARWPLFSIVQDATAPHSASSVGEMKYVAGASGGYAPGYAQKNFPAGKSRVYLSLYVKLSSNFVGHPSYVNKMLFMWMAGQPKFILAADGPGTGALVPSIRVQDSPDGTEHRWPNVATSAQVVRGQWQHWEVVITANTPGQANGQVQWWIDGTLVSDYRDLALAAGGESPSWQIFQWGPTWGGVGSSVPADMYVRWDNVYVSVAP